MKKQTSKEEAKALAKASIGSKSAAARAVLEFVENEIDCGQGKAMPGPAWKEYCKEKGNCPQAKFEKPLCDALHRFFKALLKRKSEQISFCYGACRTCFAMAFTISFEFTSFMYWARRAADRI